MNPKLTDGHGHPVRRLDTNPHFHGHVDRDGWGCATDDSRSSPGVKDAHGTRTTNARTGSKYDLQFGAHMQPHLRSKQVKGHIKNAQTSGRNVHRNRRKPQWDSTYAAAEEAEYVRNVRNCKVLGYSDPRRRLPRHFAGGPRVERQPTSAPAPATKPAEHLRARFKHCTPTQQEMTPESLPPALHTHRLLSSRSLLGSPAVGCRMTPDSQVLRPVSPAPHPLWHQKQERGRHATDMDRFDSQKTIHLASEHGLPPSQQPSPDILMVDRSGASARASPSMSCRAALPQVPELGKPKAVHRYQAVRDSDASSHLDHSLRTGATVAGPSQARLAGAALETVTPSPDSPLSHVGLVNVPRSGAADPHQGTSHNGSAGGSRQRRSPSASSRYSTNTESCPSTASLQLLPEAASSFHSQHAEMAARPALSPPGFVQEAVAVSRSHRGQLGALDEDDTVVLSNGSTSPMSPQPADGLRGTDEALGQPSHDAVCLALQCPLAPWQLRPTGSPWAAVPERSSNGFDAYMATAHAWRPDSLQTGDLPDAQGDSLGNVGTAAAFPS